MSVPQPMPDRQYRGGTLLPGVHRQAAPSGRAASGTRNRCLQGTVRDAVGDRVDQQRSEEPPGSGATQLGNFHRPGQTYTQQTVETFDHDFPSAGDGKLIPHGIYDTTHNHAAIHLNTSHDTSELCCDSIALWWEEHGRAAWPEAKRLLVLCDGGGSNSANQYVFKEDLQCLADRLGIELRVAHYPPYCSKHNPIEHRVFPHVSRACQGVIFHSVEIAKQFIERAKTSTGLRVTVSILEKVYETGRKCAADFKSTMKIVYDDYLGKWNYRALPQTS